MFSACAGSKSVCGNHDRANAFTYDALRIARSKERVSSKYTSCIS